MGKKIGRRGLCILCRDLAVVMFVLTSGCTGSVSRPGGATNPDPSGGMGPGHAMGTGGNMAGTGNVSGTGNAPGTGSVVGTGNTTGAGGATGAPPGLPSIWKSVVPSTTLDPGRVVMRRLNNAEYNNTVRDLLGTTALAATKWMFPADNATDGFDTVGAVLSYSSLLFENQETAAGQLVDELLARPIADPLRKRVLICEPTMATLATCLPQILTPFMKNAYRRPAVATELADMVTLATTIATSAADPMRGLNAALKAILLSPHFLFKVEGGTPNAAAATALTDHELATRLSYFLWSTMPDTTLLTAADTAKLKPAGADLTAQITRMLADPKAQAFTDNFGGQWLSLREVNGVAPEAALFTTFDEGLRSSIAQETNAFFASLIKDAQPLTALLVGDFTFANARLAKHYGLPAVPGTAFARVSLAGNAQRGGILTQETFLMVTSMSNRTSPVRRGNWVLEHLLCDLPPLPPAVLPVGDLKDPVPNSGVTVREALTEHRQNPVCSACHNTIDPVGLTFENYDAIGTYRTMDNGDAVDATGSLVDLTGTVATKVNGAKEMSQAIAADTRFTYCLVKQALTYGVGRSFDTVGGNAYVAGLAAPLVGKGTWPDLLRTIATSQAFLTRRGEGP